MLNLDSIDSREDFKWELIFKATKDAQFKSLLRSKPQDALKQVLGADLPQDIRLNVHQENPGEVFFLINFNPSLPAKADQITIKSDDNPEAVLVKKAWKSVDFRRTLLSQPEETFKAEFGATLPPGMSLRVLAEERASLELILPAALADGGAPAKGGSQLSDAELDTVSGGGLWEWLAQKLYSPPSASTNSGSCGCVSASGVRG